MDAPRPRQIRSDAAEQLYVVLQSKDLGCTTDAAEDVLLETEWCVPQTFRARTWSGADCGTAAGRAGADMGGVQARAAQVAQLLSEAEA